MHFSKHDIFEQLKSIGLFPGDILLLKANLSRIGVVSRNAKYGFFDTLIEYLGPNGTLIVPTFTKTYFLPFFNKNTKIFTKETLANTGGLSKIILEKNSFRSSHPTNSFAGIGKHAHKILKDHTEESHSFAPIEKIIDMNGKGLIIGCLKSSPGHLTAHLAQYHLGQSTQNLFRSLAGATYYKNNKLKVFLRRDFGGHAAGAIKFYDHYEKDNAIKYGKIGNADSGISDLCKVYNIEKKLLKKDPKYILCNDPICFSCRATWRYNLKDIPRYFFAKSIHVLKK